MKKNKHKDQISNKKKLLIYAHYYTPDVASTAQILQELAEGMLDIFNITVICVVPSYNGDVEKKYQDQKFYEERINNVNVLRIRVSNFTKTNKMSRIQNILGYFLGAMIATLKTGKQDYVFAISQPPILGGLLGVWGKWIKHAKFIYNIQDFNPEQIKSVGYIKNNLVLKIMLCLDKFSCRQSNLVITVGCDLVQTMNIRFSDHAVPKTELVNNWISEKEIYPLSPNHNMVVLFKNQYDLNGKFVIMYSGNIGLYYDLINLIKVIEKIKPGSRTPDGREVIFAFVGAGSVLEKLMSYVQKHKMDNVRFIPYQTKENLIYSLNAGDVHWCVNAKGIKGVSCPSKFYGIAAVAKPVLGVLENKTEIRILIEKTKCGFCANPGDYRQVERYIYWFIENANSKEFLNMGENGYKYLIDNLTKDISVTKYKEKIINC